MITELACDEKAIKAAGESAYTAAMLDDTAFLIRLVDSIGDMELDAALAVGCCDHGLAEKVLRRVESLAEHCNKLRRQAKEAREEAEISTEMTLTR